MKDQEIEIVKEGFSLTNIPKGKGILIAAGVAVVGTLAYFGVKYVIMPKMIKTEENIESTEE